MSGLRFWHLAAGVAFLIIPSLGVVQKYLGTDAAYASVPAGGAAAVLVWTFRRHLARLLAPCDRLSKVAAAVLVVALAASFVVLYPTTAGGGSDRDEALNLAIAAVFDGRNPYFERTHLGNSISQLPGSFLLAMPFALLGNAAWQNLFWFPAWLLALRSLLGRHAAAVLVVTITLALSPVVLQDFVTGGDLATNAIVVLSNFVALLRSDRFARRPFVCGVVTGVALATRLPFLLLLPLMFVLLRSGHGAKPVTRWLAASLIAWVALVAPFYLADPGAFTPFEAQNKFGILEEVWPWVPIVAPLVAAGLALAAAFAGRRGTGAALVAAGVVLSLPPAALVAGMRLAGSWNMSPAAYALPGLIFALPGLWLLAERQEIHRRGRQSP